MPRKGRTWRKRHGHLSPNLKQKTLSLSLQHEKTFISLMSWMKSNGFGGKTLKPADFSATGRGLLTLVPLLPGDEIISVPKKLMITTQTVMDSYLGRVFEKHRLLECPTPTQLICLYLVYEKTKGLNSFWYPYISSLPESFSTPAFFTVDEMNCLPGTLHEKALGQLESVKDSYAGVKVLGEMIEKCHPELHGGLTWEQYLWAWGVVNTRSVYMKQSTWKSSLSGDTDNAALVPFLDMLNHSSTAKVKAEFNESTNYYTITTEDSYRKYDQVFISYGPHDNAKLLLEYGFVLPFNPHNAVVFSKDDLHQLKILFTPSQWKKKLLMLEENDLLTSLGCSHDGPSWNLQCVFRILVRDWETRMSCGEYLMSEPSETESKQMKRLFDLVLRNKLSNIQECKNRTEGCPPSYHTSMITTLLEQMTTILIKRNLKRVTFDTG